MPSSPTLVEFNSKLKNRYGFKNILSLSRKSYSFLIIIYPIIVLCALLIIKPKMILKTSFDQHDENDNEKEISYDKLIIWYICLQIPVFVYVFIRMSETVEQ
jgi:hypothetical protein